jgi:hypothetical protein
MYQLGKRSKHTERIATISAVVVVLLLVVAGVSAARHYFKDETSLNQAPATTHTVRLSDVATETFQQPTFSIGLPHGWQEASPVDSRHHPYSWRGTSSEDQTRSLDIYVDDIPTDMAVNRLLPVQADGNQLDSINTVSDNCAGFTGVSDKSDVTGTALAKWSGVKFVCDMGNVTRNVTGTSSPTGINSVGVAGKQGMHQYFFVYTDNSSSPDYGIFTRALTTFRAK